MKRMLLSMLMLMSLATVQAAAPRTYVLPSPTMTPLSGSLEFLAEDGTSLGHMQEAGVVELQGGATMRDVSSVRVLNGAGSAFGGYYLTLGDTPQVVWFGPAGQPVRLRLPLLSSVQWVSSTGHQSRLMLSNR